MAARSGLERGTLKHVETVDLGAPAGAVTITHNLGTQDLTMYVRATANDWAVMMPYSPLNDTQVEVETTWPANKEVEITLIG